MFFISVNQIRHYINHQHASDISIELCALSIKSFDNGWNITAIDKDGIFYFHEIKNDLDLIELDKKQKMIITIWKNENEPDFKLDLEEQYIFYIKELHDLQIRENVLYGWADIHDVHHIDYTIIYV